MKTKAGDGWRSFNVGSSRTNVPWSCSREGGSLSFGPAGDGQKLNEALAWALSMQSCHVFLGLVWNI